MAVLIAAFSRGNSLSFYHAALIGQCWALTSTSLSAAIVSDLQTLDPRDKEKVHGIGIGIWEIFAIKARHLAFIVNLVLVAVFQMQQNLKLWYEWDILQSGKCFRTNDHSSWIAVWFFFGGVLLNLVTLVVSLPNAGQRLGYRISEKMKQPARYLGGQSVDVLDEFQRSTRLWTRVALMLRLLSTAIALLIYCAFLQFIARWTASDALRILDMALYIGFSAWSTWNIVDIKTSSRPLLVDSESTWGFGQVLPMLMLLGLAVSVFSAAKGVFQQQPENEKDLVKTVKSSEVELSYITSDDDAV